jgi:ATP-dependent exoDNAse (exonuclease V) beta subunit
LQLSLDLPLRASVSRELTAEQARVVDRREGRLIVSANAGSGKTTVLSERFVRSCIDDGIEPAAILAITFTEKAAGELRERVRTRFTELGRRDLAQATEAAWVSTIHGFCARVLRANAVTAGLDPAFTVLDEGDARALRTDAFERALATWMGNGGETRAEALDVAAVYGVDNLRKLIWSVHDRLRSRGEREPRLPEPARSRAIDELRADLAAAIAPALAEIGEPANKTSTAAVEALQRCGEALAASGPVGNFKVGRGAGALTGTACDEYRSAHTAYLQGLVDDAARPVWRLLGELLERYASAYAEAKRARSAVDYDDLELFARDLFAGDESIRARYAERFARIMVDEFQDTNRLQLGLLDLLGADRAFYVGDAQQSIYRFRHASVDLFRDLVAQLRRDGQAEELAKNFRTRAPVLEAINAAFGDMEGYVPLVAGREATASSTPLVDLLLTDSDGWDGVDLGALPSGRPDRCAEARLVAQRVRDLVDAGDCKAGDVCVLLRASTDMETFERALEDQGFATLASGGRGFWARQQVLDLTSYLAALANPRDEEALLAVLASPIVGASSDTLALLGRAARAGGGTLWDALHGAFCPDGGDSEDGIPPTLARVSDDDRERLERFCPAFSAERALAPRLGLDTLLERVIERTGYDEHVLRLPGGRRRMANVTKLIRLAASHEARAGRDVRGFIDRARAELEAEAREPDAPIEIEGLDAVRLMTVHAAKGLEFGVVVLADLGRKPPGGGEGIRLGDDGSVGFKLKRLGAEGEDAFAYRALGNRERDEEREEDMRVFYVGCTRAKERLILSGTVRLDKWPNDGPGATPITWLAPRFAPKAAEGEGTQLVSVVHSRAADLGTVLREGIPAPRPRPAAAAGGAGAASDIPELPVPPPPPAVRSLSYSALSGYAACPYRFYLERVLRLPRVPEPPAAAPAEPDALDRMVRGSIAHLLLEQIDLEHPEIPDRDAVELAASMSDAEVGEDDIADLQALVRAAIEGDVLGRALAAVRVRREEGFAFMLDGVPFTGYVDLLAEEADGTALVIDYKTNPVQGVDLETLTEADYGAQRRIYALAALRSGAPAVEVVHLYLERPDEPVVATYVAADLARLEAGLRESAAALLRGEFPVAAVPHIGLCAGCPARASLCVHPPELTGRVL